MLIFILCLTCKPILIMLFSKNPLLKRQAYKKPLIDGIAANLNAGF